MTNEEKWLDLTKKAELARIAPPSMEYFANRERTIKEVQAFEDTLPDGEFMRYFKTHTVPRHMNSGLPAWLKNGPREENYQKNSFQK